MKVVIAILIACGATGCVRSSFDLCAVDPPHPDCLLLDAGPRDAAPDGAGDADAAGDGDASDSAALDGS